MDSNRLGRRFRDSLLMLFTEDLNHIDEDVGKAIQCGWITFNVLAYALAKDKKCFNHLIRYLHDSPITERQTMKGKLMLCFGILGQMKSEYPGFPPMYHKEGNEWRKVDVAKSYQDDGTWIFMIDELKIYFKSKGIPWLAEDIDEKIIEISEKSQEHTAPAPAVPPVPAKTSAVNFFTRRNRGIWDIGFEGKAEGIKHLGGFLYIRYLLEKPGTPISCKELYQSAAGGTPDKIMSEGAAIDEGFNIGSSKQEVIGREAKQNYVKKYRELQNDHEKAESDMERQEIENEMDALMPYLNLKERNFADPDEKKAQVNVTKRLRAAYEAIGKEAHMEELAKHLQAYIKPNGAYGLTYTGTAAWEITIK